MRVLAAVAACLLLISCEQGAPLPFPSPAADLADPNGAITTATVEPEVLDPQQASFPNEVSQVAMVYEPLLTFEPKTLRPIPAAARDLPVVSDDGLTLTFTLREGLEYSDGAPVRAADFVFGWSRICDPAVGGGNLGFLGEAIVGCTAWSVLDPVRTSTADLAAAGRRLGIRAEGDQRIIFTLTRPAPYFPSIAALTAGVPTRRSDVTAGGAKWTEAAYIGNGPFKLVEWTHGQRLVFARNDRYRDPPKLAQWTKKFMIEPAEARIAFAHGELDVALAAPSDPPTVSGPGGVTYSYGFNTLRSPFDDPAVRLAFAKAIDRSAFMPDPTESAQRPAASLIPPGVPGFDPQDTTQTFEPLAARALLAGSRYAAAMPEIRFTYADQPRNRAMVAFAIAQWQRELGVQVRDDPIDRGSCCGFLKKPETMPQIFLLQWTSDYPDPQNWLSLLFHSNATAQRTFYASREFDGLVERADVERDPARRMDLYRQAQRVLTRDAPVAVLSWSEQRYLVAPRLHGYELSANDLGFAQFSVAHIWVSKVAPTAPVK